MAARTALLAGATGQVGRHCLRLLLEGSTYQAVHVIARGAASAQDTKLVWHQVDFTTIESLELPPIDDAFCALGVRRGSWTNRHQLRLAEFEYPLAVAKLAKARGANRFQTVTSVASNANSPFHYLALKGRLEREFKNLGFSSLDLFRPSFLLSEDSPLNIVNALLRGPLRKYRAVSPREVAEAMVRQSMVEQAGVRIHHFGSPTPESPSVAGRPDDSLS